MEHYRKILDGIKERNACGAVDMIDSFDTMAASIREAQSIEFITNTNYPDADAMRSLKCYDLRNKGIFVDEGIIELHNPEMPVISAGTIAKITYGGDVKNYSLLCMDGSDVTIIADGWAIVRVFKAPGAKVTVKKGENALVHISTREGRRK